MEKRSLKMVKGQIQIGQIGFKAVQQHKPKHHTDKITTTACSMKEGGESGCLDPDPNT